MTNTGVLVLAAGGSTRLGRPKQLIDWHGKSMVRHLAEVALAADLGPVAVVLGHAAVECQGALGDLPVLTAINPGWTLGMGSSIRVGLTTLVAEELQAMIVMLCDQPFITAAMLCHLAAEQQRTGAAAVASAFQGTLGPPVLFTRERFAALQALTPDQGAKSLFRGETSLATLACPAAALDIDTEEDLTKALEVPHRLTV